MNMSYILHPNSEMSAHRAQSLGSRDNDSPRFTAELPQPVPCWRFQFAVRRPMKRKQEVDTKEAEGLLSTKVNRLLPPPNFLRTK